MCGDLIFCSSTLNVQASGIVGITTRIMVCPRPGVAARAALAIYILYVPVPYIRTGTGVLTYRYFVRRQVHKYGGTRPTASEPTTTYEVTDSGFSGLAGLMAFDRQWLLVFGTAALLRTSLFYLGPSLPDLLAGRVELSTPVTSFKRCEDADTQCTPATMSNKG